MVNTPKQIELEIWWQDVSDSYQQFFQLGRHNQGDPSVLSQMDQLYRYIEQHEYPIALESARRNLLQAMAGFSNSLKSDLLNHKYEARTFLDRALVHLQEFYLLLEKSGLNCSPS